MSTTHKDFSIFDLIVGEEFGADGKTRTSWTSVGTVFRDNSSGKISGKIKDGLALTGQFIIRARQPKLPSEASQNKPEANL